MTPTTRRKPELRSQFSPVGLEDGPATEVAELLQQRLHGLNDLALTLKHVHWNVTGPHFIGVHTMLDPQVDAVRTMVDETAERIATLGASPVGTPGALVEQRTWADYPLGRADTSAHLSALDAVYTGVIGDHRKLIEVLDTVDPVTQDMVIDQSRALEQFQWFIRAHLETASGQIQHAGVQNGAKTPSTSR